MNARETLNKNEATAADTPRRHERFASQQEVRGPNPLWQSLAMRLATVQRKLSISQPGDPYEQEADRTAARVMRLPDRTEGAGDRSQPIPGEAKQPGKRRQSTAGQSGKPLDPATRAFFEPRFGEDFGNVTIHNDWSASASASAVKARAFTVGEDIFYGPGDHDPESKSHLPLLAHELTHVIQQREGRSQTGIQRQPDTSYVDHGATAHAMGTFDSKTRVYTVPSDKSVYPDQSKPFDTFFSIALRFGTTAQAIQELNGVTLKPGQQIKIPTVVSESKPQQEEMGPAVEQDAPVVNPAVSTDTLSSEETPDTSIANTVSKDMTTTTAPKQIVVHKPIKTKQESSKKAAQTAATISATAISLAHGLLHKYASFLPGTEQYFPFTLDEKGLGTVLAQSYVSQPSVVFAVLDLTQWGDRDDVASELVGALWARQLLDPAISTQMLKRLRAEIDASWVLNEAKKSQVHVLDMVLRIRGIPPLQEESEPSKKKKAGQQPSQLAEEYGLEMIDEPEYQATHAYLPFKGKKSGTSYEKGDVIAEEDRKAHYGSSSRPTWCNQFMMDLCKKILKKDIFKDAKSKNADGLIKYMKDTPGKFEEIAANDESPFKQAWTAINEGSLVFFGGPGHVSTGVPTPIDKLSSRTLKGSGKTYWFGEVIQAGASTGKMLLNEAWGKASFPSLKAFKYIGKEDD